MKGVEAEGRVEVFQPRNKTQSEILKARSGKKIVRASIHVSHLLRSRFPGAGSDLGRALQKTVMQCKITKGEVDEGDVGGGGLRVAARPFYVETKRSRE